MREDERIWSIGELLSDYVKSPSLRHIRDPHSVTRVAQEIVRRIDRGNSIWRKWDGQCEVLPKSAVACWIPIEEMRAFLNQMPGPALTAADVAQRLEAFEEEQREYPDEQFQPGCLALYEQEKAAGTELPAIVGLLRDHVEREEERIRVEQQERYAHSREQDRIAREMGRLRSWLRREVLPSMATRSGRPGQHSATQEEKQAANRSGSIRFITVRSQSAHGMPW